MKLIAYVLLILYKTFAFSVYLNRLTLIIKPTLSVILFYPGNNCNSVSKTLTVTEMGKRVQYSAQTAKSTQPGR